MTALLDTHFLLWIALGSRRLREYPWVERYAPWTVSPVALLEIAFLGEVGRVEVRHAEFVERLGTDPRFVIDDAGSVALATAAFGLSWTRDPFDRLLVAHSAVRRLRLCTVDPVMLEHHSLIVRELAAR